MSMLAYAKPLLGVAIGGVGGYLYYRYVGCLTGACPLSSNPYIMVTYGMLLGGWIAWG